jgi:GNAT superfamily N-acetyltransferase
MAMKPVWSARPYIQGDEEGIFELDKAVHPERSWHNKEEWMQRWRWMYQQNPAGSPLIWLAQHNDRIISQAAIIPIKMKIGNDIIMGSQWIDIMTHPDYRGKGIFVNLSQCLFEQAAKQGINVIYGFSGSSTSWHRKYWQEVIKFNNMVRPLNWKNTLKFRIHDSSLSVICAVGGNLISSIFYRTKESPVIDGLSINRVSTFDERVNKLWEKVSVQYNIIAVRNLEFLTWRYISIPDVKYTIFVAEKSREICGYIVLRSRHLIKQVKTAIVYDVMAQSGQIAQSLILKAILHFQEERIDFLYCKMIANDTILKAFRRCGFITIPFSYSGYFYARSSSSNINDETLRNRRNWFIQIGDSDFL